MARSARVFRSTRRRFLQSTALGAAASMSALSWGQVVGANDAVRIAVVGFNGRGGEHLQGFGKLPDVRIVALCDCDSKVLEAGVARVQKKTGKPVRGYVDLRKLLEDKEVDAISTATPNHWHSLAVVWTCQAGKDIYVEKPVSHNIFEGRKAVEAARKYNRIVQTGTQSRSSRDGIGAAVDWVKAGNLGKIVLARGLCYKRRASIGKADGPLVVPPNIDFDLWCGPAPKEPIHRKKLHYDWHWVWPTGNGDLGNQGIHQMDIARWFVGENELPSRVWSVGGRFGYEDDGTTPNTLMVFLDYTKAPLLFEVRGLPCKTGSKEMDKFQGAGVGVVIHCEGGSVTVPNYSSAIAYDSNGKEIKKWSGATDHFANFIKAVRSRKKEDLHADILEGHLSSAMCHLGNISYRLGAQAAPDVIRQQIQSDRDATATLERMSTHLAANEVDLKLTKAMLGPVLRLDPKAERFLENDRANEMLTRQYRAPFVVPQEV